MFNFILTVVVNAAISIFFGFFITVLFINFFGKLPLEYLGIRLGLLYNAIAVALPIFFYKVPQDLKKEKHMRSDDENCVSGGPIEILSFTRPRSLFFTAGNASLNIKVRNNSEYPVQFTLIYKVDGKWKRSGYVDTFDIEPRKIETLSVLGPAFSTVEDVCISSYR